MYTEQKNGKSYSCSPKIDQISIIHYDTKRNGKRHTYCGIYYLLFAAKLFIKEQEQGSYQVKGKLSRNIPIESCVPCPISDAGYVIEKIKCARLIKS